jgi:hypothetical protein
VLLFLRERGADATAKVRSAPSFAAPNAPKLTAKIGDFGLATGMSRNSCGESSSTRLGGGTLPRLTLCTPFTSTAHTLHPVHAVCEARLSLSDITEQNMT